MQQQPTNLQQSSSNDSGETEGEKSIVPDEQAQASKDTKETTAASAGDTSGEWFSTEEPKSKQQKTAHSPNPQETSKHYGDDSKHSSVQGGTRIHIPVSMEG